MIGPLFAQAAYWFAVGAVAWKVSEGISGGLLTAWY